MLSRKMEHEFFIKFSSKFLPADTRETLSRSVAKPARWMYSTERILEFHRADPIQHGQRRAQATDDIRRDGLGKFVQVCRSHYYSKLGDDATRRC